MRHFVVDTDTGSDDAIALLMMLLCDGVQVEAVSCVHGNIGLWQAAQNALATIERAGGQAPPVYLGAARPLVRTPVTAQKVHGKDGMGDCGLVRPQTRPAAGHAVDVLCRLARQYPGQLEILAIGPATNLALAIMQDPAAMAGVKHIYAMGTGGFAPGRFTAVAEFNVFADAEAYAVLLASGIPITIAGFDLCTGAAALQADEIAGLQQGPPLGRWAVQANRTLLEYNQWRFGEGTIDMPDPVAAAVALWPDVVVEARDCHCYTCLKEAPVYGMVLAYDPAARRPTDDEWACRPPNATVVKTIDVPLFKRRVLGLLAR